MGESGLKNRNRDKSATRELKMEQDTETTIVIFRAEKSGQFKGDVTAVFPTIPSDIHGDWMTCYAHVGQHSGCSKGWYNDTRPATESEYAALAKELTGAGYRLDVKRRITRAMDDARRKAARADAA